MLNLNFSLGKQLCKNNVSTTKHVMCFPYSRVYQKYGSTKFAQKFNVSKIGKSPIQSHTDLGILSL
jgi:hypothetical protein